MIFYDLMEEANGSALALRRRYFEGHGAFRAAPGDALMDVDFGGRAGRSLVRLLKDRLGVDDWTDWFEPSSLYRHQA